MLILKVKVMKHKVERIEQMCLSTNCWRQICRQKQAIIGIVMVLFFVLVAVMAPIIAPNDPTLVDIALKLKVPSAKYWLGTDNLGRCIASRLIWGSRYSLFYSMLVMVITLMIGIPIGLIAGYVGGRLDNIIMRIIDVFLSTPTFIVALAIAGTLGASGKNMVLAMSCVWWSGYARLIRSMTIQIKGQEFIQAEIAGGAFHREIIFKHIFMNILPSVVALSTIQVGSAILAIAGYSFIGIGVQPPTPEWGIMLSDSRNYLQTSPELMIYPGLAIVFTVLAFNLLGEGIKNGAAKRG